MFYRIKDRLRRAQFRNECRGILDVPPLQLDPAAPAVVFSQLPHKDLLMFLSALRSFVRHVPVKAVHLLNDGSLWPEDRAALRELIPGVALYELADFRSGLCPMGGCWERLLGIAELVRDDYVIQLDSDTLAIGAIDEVATCTRTGTAFTLGTWNGQELETMAARAAEAKRLVRGADTHIQILAEAHLDRLTDYASLRYVRGCAGFAGFPAGSFTKARLEALSQEMYAALGARWNTWGSEQFASNVIVANVAQAMVLPHPKYCACNRVTAETAFIHFIGGCRFDNGTYARLARRVIDELQHA